MALVYKATCLVNGKAYVGFTAGTLERRRRQHERAAALGKKACPLFYAALRAHGPASFTWEVLFEGMHDDALWFEPISIRSQRTLAPNGLNLTEGGESPSWSAESRAKVSRQWKGISKRMDAAVEAARLTNTGRTWTEEQRGTVLRSRAQSAKVEAARRRGQDARRGARNTPEHNAKLSASRRLSDEVASRARGLFEEGLSPGKVAGLLGVSRSALYRVKNRTHGY